MRLEGKMNKKRIVFTSILTALGVAFVLISLLVPMVHIVGKDLGENIVYDQSVSLVRYVIDAPFVMTDAADIYFDATGPIWTASGSIMAFLLTAVSGLVMFLCGVVELITAKRENISVKSNCLLKKVSLFTGYLTILLSVFAIVSFIVTTMLAGGMVEFYTSFAPCFLLGIGIATVVLAHLLCKREKEQVSNKVKNSVGFGLVALFSVLAMIFVFIPQYEMYFDTDFASFFSLSTNTNIFASDPYILHTLGDLPMGLVFWGILLLFVATAFVFVYSLIGFIFTLMGKKTDWLSSRVKRWSMAYLIVYSVIYFLVFCTIGVIWSTLAFDGYQILTALSYAVMFLPLFPYVFSTMVSVNKKQKEAKAETIK